MKSRNESTFLGIGGVTADGIAVTSAAATFYKLPCRRISINTKL